MTAVASVAAMAAAARVFVFSQLSIVLWGFLEFSLVFFGLIGLSRAFSDFLFFWGPFGVPLGTFGVPLCLSESLWVPLGSPWCALGPPFGRCGSLWHPLGVALGSLWGTSGVSLLALGSLGLPGAARGCPKMLKIRKHTFLHIFAHVYKSMCVFVCFSKRPRVHASKHTCFYVFSYFRGRSRSEPKHIGFCVFLRPGFRKTHVFVGFCVWAIFRSPRVKCGDLYVFLYVFEAFLKREPRVNWCGERRPA